MAISVEDRKIFQPPLYFASPLKGLPWNWVPALGVKTQKTRKMALPSRERSLTISSAIWIQCINLMDRADGQTDRQTPGDSKDRAYA